MPYDIKSFLLLLLEYFLDDHLFLPINIDSFGHVPAFCNDEVDLFLCWCSQNLPIKCVDNTLDRLIVSITSVICACRNCIWLVFSGLLGGTWWFYTVKVLLIESSVIINAMFPVIFFEVEIIIEDILSTNHFSLLPLCFIEATLHKKTKYIRIDKSSLPMEVTFDEMPFVNNSIIHLQFAETMVPSFSILSLILIVEPGRHL